MVREAQHKGQTIFLSSHVLSEVQQTADTVAILRDGRIIAVESVSGLREGAVRHLRLTASGITAHDAGALLGAVPGVGRVEVLESGSTVTVTATLEGDIGPLVRALGTLELKDLVLEEPDLEQSVLTMYASPQEAGK